MDERRRDRERAAAQGDHAAAVEALRHRLRVGEVTEERLELLVFLGDEVAAAALGRAVEPWPTDEQGRERRALVLARWGAECLGRAGAALARGGAELARDDRVRAAAGAIDAWLLCPCDDHIDRAQTTAREQAEEAAHEASEIAEERTLGGAFCVAHVAQGLGRLKGSWIREHGQTQESQEQKLAKKLGSGMLSLWSVGLDPVAVMLSELRPWALGTGDPVRERVAGRGG